jgi:eukaryotic-like serine/threonine-protein kinase
MSIVDRRSELARTGGRNPFSSRSELARTGGRNPFSQAQEGYEVIAHLSRTRRLDTYEVWSHERACSCVVKTLRPDRRDDERARAALLAEGRLLTTLAHPHIVRGYELIDGPEPAVVMETLDGETLAHLIARHPEGLYAQELAWLGLHLASALHYLHRWGILHLDVKPANVIAEAGRAKLIDLSLARPPGRRRPGLGTWSNLAPEQARGDELGTAADVWGLGTVLYEGAAGRPPFRDDDDGSWTDDTGPSRTWDTDDQLQAGYPQLEGSPPLLTGLPDDLAATITACLAPEPNDRPSLAELAARLTPHAPEARPWDA